MLQHYCAWRCTLFWLTPHIQIQYDPLSLHVANTFCICSPLAGHILLSGSFWCSLLPGLELLQVVPLFLLLLLLLLLIGRSIMFSSIMSQVENRLASYSGIILIVRLASPCLLCRGQPPLPLGRGDGGLLQFPETP